MSKTKALIFSISILVFSCRETNQLSFLDDLPTKELPYTESVDIINIRDELKPKLSETQIKMLGLRKLFAGRHLIYSDPDLAFTENVYMRYRLNLSNIFKTVVLSCHDWRFYTILLNYKNEFDVIDFEVIAFDFVDERNFRIFSLINKDKLEITHATGLDDSTTTVYKIERDGTINPSH